MPLQCRFDVLKGQAGSQVDGHHAERMQRQELWLETETIWSLLSSWFLDVFSDFYANILGQRKLKFALKMYSKIIQDATT